MKESKKSERSAHRLLRCSALLGIIDKDILTPKNWWHPAMKSADEVALCLAQVDARTRQPTITTHQESRNKTPKHLSATTPTNQALTSYEAWLETIPLGDFRAYYLMRVKSVMPNGASKPAVLSVQMKALAMALSARWRVRLNQAKRSLARFAQMLHPTSASTCQARWPLPCMLRMLGYPDIQQERLPLGTSSFGDHQIGVVSSMMPN